MVLVCFLCVCYFVIGMSFVFVCVLFFVCLFFVVCVVFKIVFGVCLCVLVGCVSQWGACLNGGRFECVFVCKFVVAVM